MSEQHAEITISIPAELLAADAALAATKTAYYQNRASYDDMRAAARAVLEQRIIAERAKFGKARTTITNLAIAKLLR